MLRFLVLAFFVASAFAQKEVNFEYCKVTGGGKINKLVAVPCDSDPCVLKKGKTVKYEFEYVSDQDSETAEIDGRISVLGAKVKIPKLESNLCAGAIKCPIKKGDVVKGEFSIPVPRAPIRKTTVDIKIIGDNAQLSSCITFPVLFK